MLNPLVYVLDNGMCISDAIDAPRCISKNAPTDVELPLLSNSVAMKTLAQRGFQIKASAQGVTSSANE